MGWPMPLLVGGVVPGTNMNDRLQPSRRQAGRDEQCSNAPLAPFVGRADARLASDNEMADCDATAAEPVVATAGGIEADEGREAAMVGILDDDDMMTRFESPPLLCVRLTLQWRWRQE